MDLLEGIYSRRSLRKYTDRPVDRDLLLEIIRAGTWAPSGLNNQPWRFVIVTDGDLRGKMAALTKYSRIINEAPACIAVFVDREVMYHEVKDHQAMGACLQNMLLAAHALGLGAVWLGEILKNGPAVRELLDLAENLDLMAVVAIGHPADKGKISRRRAVDEVLLKEL
jgi:nitroreductase